MSEAAQLDALRGKLTARGGLTAAEWTRHDYLSGKLDPAGWETRKRESRRRYLMKQARELSLEDLRALVAEKEAAQAVS
jgi:N-acetylmuramoyl-L-alanine amidase CwlA